MATKQPDDKSHFILPDLGEGVHEAELIKWRVQPGEVVQEHQTIAEMETDKALVEVPSPWTGTIGELRGNPGDIINVGNILVTYVVDGAAPPAETPEAQPAKAEASAAESGADDGDAGTVVGTVSGELSVSERFTRRESENTDNGTSNGRSLATPAVRRIARELKVDINTVSGTGRGGRVTASDVHAASTGSPMMEFAPQIVQVPAQLPQVDTDGVSERIPFIGVRRKIAQALDHSVKTAVHFTVVEEADVTELEKKRAEYAGVLGRKISILPFVMTAVCRALRKHPTLNANVDDANSEILLKGVVNLGCAVDTDHGLMVPVIPNADQLTLTDLAAQVAEVAAGCKDRTIDREKLSGGTFTISNVGSYGGMFATPIINYPEVAILAAGRTKERVLARNGMFYAGSIMPLSLSCDHRVVDGAEGSRFLNTVVQLLENPSQMLG